MLVGCLSISTFATTEIDLEIRDRIGFAPKLIKAKVTVEPHDANRLLCVEAHDGEFIVQRRCYEIDGTSPRTHWFTFKRVDAGRYVFYAVVERSLETKRSVGLPVRVLAPGESLGGDE